MARPDHIGTQWDYRAEWGPKVKISPTEGASHVPNNETLRIGRARALSICPENSVVGGRIDEYLGTITCDYDLQDRASSSLRLGGSVGVMGVVGACEAW